MVVDDGGAGAFHGGGAQGALTSGLIGYYDFESGLNNIANTALNPTVISGTPTAGTAGGIVGNALGLDKAEFDAIRVAVVAHPTNPTNLAQNFSISAWFKNEHVGADPSRSFVYEAANNFDVSLGTGSASGPDTYTHYVAETSAGTSSLQRDVWNHVIHTFSSDGTITTLQVYVNGVNTHTQTANTASMSFTDLNIGKARNGTGTGVAAGRYFEGLIDEFAIWNRTITASEAAEVHSRGLNGFGLFDQITTGPVTKYVFDADGTEPGAALGASITMTGWNNNFTFASVAGPNNDLGDGGFAGNFFRTTGTEAAPQPNGNHVITITLTDLAEHTHVNLGMLLAQIDSLDPNRDGDRFIVRLDGAEILNAGFGWGTTVGSNTEPFVTTGDPALDAELLALRTQHSANLYLDGSYWDNIYDLSQLSLFQNIAHTGSSLTLEIIGRQNQSSGEFYGLDNISITLANNPVPEPATIGLLGLAGMALLRRRRVA